MKMMYYISDLLRNKFYEEMGNIFWPFVLYSVAPAFIRIP